MIRTLLFSAMGLAFAVSLSACGKFSSHKISGPSFQPEIDSEVPTSKPSEEAWDLDKVRVTCSEASCPMSVGLMVFLSPEKDGMISFKRCTAFLTTRSQITSAAHCDYTGDRQGYFITQPVRGKSIIRKITGVSEKRHTPHPTNPNINMVRPDIAVYTLERPIMEIEPAEVARMSDLKTASWSVYAINSKDNVKNFTIDRISCNRRRDEIYFPFDLGEQPDVMFGFGCTSVPGNSGAPVFSADTGLVEAVLGGKSRNPSPAIVVSNLRCMKSKDCLINDEGVRAHRFSQAKESVEKALGERELPTASQYGYKFSTHVVALKSPPAEPEAEIVYRPLCRLKDEPPQAVTFPIEHVKIRFDEWGRIQIKQVDVVEMKGQITKRLKNGYQVSAVWPQGFGTPLKAGTHLRDFLGSRFDIELPLCPR